MGKNAGGGSADDVSTNKGTQCDDGGETASEKSQGPTTRRQTSHRVMRSEGAGPSAQAGQEREASPPPSQPPSRRPDRARAASQGARLTQATNEAAAGAGNAEAATDEEWREPAWTSARLRVSQPGAPTASATGVPARDTRASGGQRKAPGLCPGCNFVAPTQAFCTHINSAPDCRAAATADTTKGARQRFDEKIGVCVCGNVVALTQCGDLHAGHKPPTERSKPRVDACTLPPGAKVTLGANGLPATVRLISGQIFSAAAAAQEWGPQRDPQRAGQTASASNRAGLPAVLAALRIDFAAATASAAAAAAAPPDADSDSGIQSIKRRAARVSERHAEQVRDQRGSGQPYLLPRAAREPEDDGSVHGGQSESMRGGSTQATCGPIDELRALQHSEQQQSKPLPLTLLGTNTRHSGASGNAPGPSPPSPTLPPLSSTPPPPPSPTPPPLLPQRLLQADEGDASSQPPPSVAPDNQPEEAPAPNAGGGAGAGAVGGAPHGGGPGDSPRSHRSDHSGATTGGAATPPPSPGPPPQPDGGDDGGDGDEGDADSVGGRRVPLNAAAQKRQRLAVLGENIATFVVECERDNSDDNLGLAEAAKALFAQRPVMRRHAQYGPGNGAQQAAFADGDVGENDDDASESDARFRGRQLRQAANQLNGGSVGRAMGILIGHGQANIKDPTVVASLGEAYRRPAGAPHGGAAFVAAAANLHPPAQSLAAVGDSEAGRAEEKARIQLVSDVINALKNDRAGGLAGHGTTDVKELWDTGRAAREAITACIRIIAEAALRNKAALAHINTCRLVALKKNKDGGVRGISIADVLVRCASAVNLRRSDDALKALMGNNVAHGTQGGAEAFVSVTRAWAVLGKAVARLDIKKAFDRVSRAALAERLRGVPGLVDYLLSRYKETVVVKHGATDDDAALLFALEEGVLQGDPLSTAIFGTVLEPVFAVVRAAYPSLGDTAFADDAILAGHPDDVVPAIELFKAEALLQLGLEINDSQEKPIVVLALVPAVAARLHALRPELKVETVGMVVAGAAVGKDDFVRRHVVARIDDARDKMRQLREVADPGLVKKPAETQAIVGALRDTVLTSLTYLLRVTPPWLVADLLAAFDDDVRRWMRQIHGLAPLPADDVERLAFERFRLPVSKGGMGLPALGPMAEAAWAGSLLLTAPVVKRLLRGDATVAGPPVAPAAGGAAAAAAPAAAPVPAQLISPAVVGAGHAAVIATLQRAGVPAAKLERLSPRALGAQQAQQPCMQRSIATHVQGGRAAEWARDFAAAVDASPDLSAQAKARLHAWRRSTSTQQHWVAASRLEPSNRMASGDWTYAVCVLLGQPVHTPQRVGASVRQTYLCPYSTCRRQTDGKAWHLLAECRHSGYARRHHLMVNAVAGTIKACLGGGVTVETEPPLRHRAAELGGLVPGCPDTELRADIAVTDHVSGKTTFADLVVALASDHNLQQAALVECVAGKAAGDAKDAHYGRFFRNTSQILAFPVEAGGRLDRRAMAFVNRIAAMGGEDVADQSGQRGLTIRKRLLTAVSVALWKSTGATVTRHNQALNMHARHGFRFLAKGPGHHAGFAPVGAAPAVEPLVHRTAAAVAEEALLAAEAAGGPQAVPGSPARSVAATDDALAG